jgi:hypothetical protein
VEAPVIVVEEGVVFEGHCRMTPPAADSPVVMRPLLDDEPDQPALAPASA